MTVLPGLIDVHAHLTMETNFDLYHELSTSIAKSALIGACNARVTLEAGFTSVRNVGADGYADVDLRDAINSARGGTLRAPLAMRLSERCTSRQTRSTEPGRQTTATAPAAEFDT